MSNVLIIESSARQTDSISRQLTRQFISQWQAAHPADRITVRDVAREPVPHLDANLLGGWMKPAEQRNDDEQISLDRSNELTDELLAADVLVMAAPMYNFAIPSTLKAWLDHVLRAGVTFKYTATGPQGLPDRQARHCAHRSRRHSCRRQLRSPGTVPAPGHGLYRDSRCDFHPCRRGEPER